MNEKEVLWNAARSVDYSGSITATAHEGITTHTFGSAGCKCGMKAVEGHRSPGRWRVAGRLRNCAKRLGVRQPSGALDAARETGESCSPPV